MLKKLLCFATLLCFLCTSLIAYADNKVSVMASYDAASESVTVTGDASGRIMIMIALSDLLRENMSEDNLPTLIKQIEADEHFEICLGMPPYADGGKYSVYAISVDGEASDSFVHINSSVAQPILTQLNAVDDDDFKTLVSANSAELGIDKTDSLYLKNRDNIFDILDDIFFETPADFVSNYSKAYALCAIEGADSDTVKFILQKYQSVLGIDYILDFQEDERISGETSSEFLSLLSDASYKSLADSKGNIDFSLFFKRCKPLASIREAVNWVGIRNAVTKDFADVCERMLSNTKYQKLQSQDAVFEAMMKMEYNSFEDIESAFEVCVDERYTKENADSLVSSERSSGSKKGSSSLPSITVPPVIETEEKFVFNDLTEEHWCYEAVQALAAEEIISGYEDGAFYPSKEITRAEFTKIILSFADDIEKGKDVMFADVSDMDWYCSAVRDAAAKGLIFGDGENFNPDDNIKRQDAALIIYRLMGLLGEAKGGYRPFADKDQISDYAKNAVYALGGLQIMQGRGDNMFCPQNTITRAETAVLVYNALMK